MDNIKINKERMDEALASETIQVPPGLTKEQIIALILSHSKSEINSQKS